MFALPRSISLAQFPLRLRDGSIFFYIHYSVYQCGRTKLCFQAGGSPAPVRQETFVDKEDYRAYPWLMGILDTPCNGHY